MTNTHDNKIVIPPEIYDYLFKFIAYEAGKQSIAYLPDYIRKERPNEYDYATTAFAKEVNEHLNDIHETLFYAYNLTDELRDYLNNILHDDLLAIERIVMLKTTAVRGENEWKL